MEKALLMPITGSSGRRRREAAQRAGLQDQRRPCGLALIDRHPYQDRNRLVAFAQRVSMYVTIIGQPISTGKLR